MGAQVAAYRHQLNGRSARDDAPGGPRDGLTVIYGERRDVQCRDDRTGAPAGAATGARAVKESRP